MTPTLRQILTAGVSLQISGLDRLKAEGPLTDVLRELIRANKPALVQELIAAPHYHWRVSYANGGYIDVWALPELNHGEMVARYPGATLQTLPESVH